MKVTRIIAAAVMTAAMAGTAQAQATPSTNSILCTGPVGSGSASPAVCRVQNTVSTTVPWVASMEIVSATTLPSPTALDFGNPDGKSTTTPTELTVKANAPVTVSATAASATWNSTSGYAKPAADLRIFLASAPSTNLALSTSTSQQVFTSSAATGGTTIGIGYNVLYSWDKDTPGSYSMVVNYTLTSP